MDDDTQIRTKGRFDAAYDAVLARWDGVTALETTSEFGVTRVHACGPTGAPPVLLLHGGGATSTAWSAVATTLGSTHRVYAPDLIGDVGRSVPGYRRPRTPADLMTWLDAVRAELGVPRATLIGHSYGAWIALSYALSHPDRVNRLALLDPSNCFSGLRAGYVLRALPMLLRPNESRARRFIEWETRGRAVDPDWLTVYALGVAGSPRPRVVLPKRPSAAALGELRVPTLVALAKDSRAIDTDRVGTAAHGTLSDVRVEVLPDSSHHTLPGNEPGQLTRILAEFLS
ncbi:alpha/beta fold hydrolase [Rhodococcus maanshanensis]|uniref:Pimeloyl-ACP methyl ester carboxylesterase n=1 Tax=Rhodococcus maanshanensis TaxID=183556 RepID=A0A1H7JV41_9NOCA|nr:alpha/beta hydrolase [Rhodococcus maanshanensis]SEK78591.1 Pimeloyl-ACP methyl ester carboxylesterase [Rhodococcus maanshanensis]